MTRIIERDARLRARMSARALFNTGAFFLAAAVPMGTADAHGRGPGSLFAIVSYAIVACAIIYLGRQVVAIWRSRRQTALDTFELGRRAWEMHKDPGAVAVLFFSLNPMPFMSIFIRQWTGSIVYPTPEQLVPLPASPVPGAGVIAPRPIDAGSPVTGAPDKES